MYDTGAVHVIHPDIYNPSSFIFITEFLCNFSSSCMKLYVPFSSRILDFVLIFILLKIKLKI
ncbi:MAG: hypothetical protein A7316_09295 [Candidatus Altiarchaeales archaeon WOR_SM1_86-2]|nr:MAG: hypothetical protein A7316_09295 [Candidatus Altiarchaeales archaeon WOR_SM1_86-2]